MRLIHTFGILALLSLGWAAPLPDPNPDPNPQRGGTRGGRVTATTAAVAPAVTPAATPGVTPAAGTSAKSSAGSAAAGTSAAAPAASAGTSAGTGTGTSSSGSTSGTGHDITVINKCPSGHVEWKYGDPATPVTTISGTQHISGMVKAGIMWLQAYEGITCSADGAGCGIIEFTLGDNNFNSINYSLLGDGLGDHQLHVPMYFDMKGPNCDAKAPGICEGMTAAECASGYTGTDTMSGQPPTCPGNDGVGVIITFCPSG